MSRKFKWNDPQSVREAYDNIRADYRMARDGRFTSTLTGTSSMGSGADYHYRSEWEWLHMVERSRYWQRNDQVVGTAVRRLSSNVVQDGFRPDPQTGDDGLDAELLARWQDWSSDPDMCHSEGEHTFHKMEQLAFEASVVDGDIFALPLRNGALQLVESHRCRTPRNTRRNVVHGILLEEQTARRLEYWFTKQNIDPYKTLERVKDTLPIAARNRAGERQVFHVYNPARSSQRRGIPLLAPAADTVGMHDDLQFAKLVQVQSAAMIAFIHNRSKDAPALPGIDAGQQKGDQETVRTVQGGTQLVEQFGPAMEVYADPGEEITGFSPNVPGSDFVPYSHMLLGFLAINLDLPLVTLLMDASMTNFSGFRGALDEARRRWRQLQMWLRSSLHVPVWKWKVRQWAEVDASIARALDNGDVNALRCNWHCPTWDYIEPLKDATADSLQDARLLNSRRRLLARRGRDIDEVDTETVNDRVGFLLMCHQGAEMIRERHPTTDVTWRDIAAPPVPDKTNASFFIEGADQDSDQDGEQ